jgi:hypothetical protein
MLLDRYGTGLLQLVAPPNAKEPRQTDDRSTSPNRGQRVGR